MNVASYEIRELSHEEFPPQLLEIPEPPKKLFLAGTLPTEDIALLAVVGSRNYTSYGREACEKIIAGLAGHPVAIVSGLAIGIDSIAHKAAMKAGLATIAIPGSGLSPSVLYPRSHVSLAEEIVENGGGLLSEFNPEFKAELWGFPKRNRIMAGYSRAVLVVEADEKSGTLITARLALDYNRDVLAIPHGIFSGNASGVNRLLKQGAAAVTCAEDILRVLGISLPENFGDNSENGGGMSEKFLSELSSDEKKIWDLLLDPLPRDEILRTLPNPASETNSLLMVMEIKGILKEELGELRRAG